MKRASIPVILAVGGVLIFLGCFVRYAWVRQVATGPFQLLWDSSQQLNSTLLDASEADQPVVSAGRRLLEPFGHLRLMRILTVPAEELHSRRSVPDGTTAAGPVQKSDPRNQQKDPIP